MLVTLPRYSSKIFRHLSLSAFLFKKNCFPKTSLQKSMVLRYWILFCKFLLKKILKNEKNIFKKLPLTRMFVISAGVWKAMGSPLCPVECSRTSPTLQNCKFLFVFLSFLLCCGFLWSCVGARYLLCVNYFGQRLTFSPDSFIRQLHVPQLSLVSDEAVRRNTGHCLPIAFHT